ncbi:MULTISPECIES: preprotein translocase subunit YajC [Ornithinimicrobium]|uniref:Preprotein translocase subunit YajC n=2 Tax=Ornithinimicrobium kibberense TaxID=282060 RepID=A0ABV5V458_9MICO|nr:MULTISPECIES: preprotein translocase subunit YajC [Ornithinimicrobium]OLT22599.1 preprotein translocase subunit YajC [Ornithinimicrobium sp. CNJ-824]
MTPLATAAAAPPTGGGMTTLLLLAVPFLVLLYLMFSQRRRARAVSEAQAALQVGDEVMAAAGIFGTVVGVEDDVVRLQVAEGVVLRVARRAVIPPGTDASGRVSRTPRDEGPGATA